MKDMCCPNCGLATDGRSGPVTCDNSGRIAGAWFKCAGCGTAYNGRTAQLAAGEGDTAETEET